jgi:DNA-binding PadR family transcriptional regulator
VSPVFGHGQLRLYLLGLLDEAPRHGYEVIRALEERFDGLYSPSAGTVYPRLARLEEEGLVEREDEGRKAVYRITEAGRAEVRSRTGDLDDLEAEIAASVRRMAAEVREEVRASSRSLRDELRSAAKQARAGSRTVGGPSDDWSAQWSGAGRKASEGLGRAESAVQQLRSEVRSLARRHGVTDVQADQVEAALTDAARTIREVLANREKPSS